MAKKKIKPYTRRIGQVTNENLNASVLTEKQIAIIKQNMPSFLYFGDAIKNAAKVITQEMLAEFKTILEGEHGQKEA